MIKTQKNIPIPPRNNREPKYPWATMKVGDSFLYEGTRGPQATYDMNKKYAPREFTSRAINEQWRIWRTK